jgi:hypothetical protein
MVFYPGIHHPHIAHHFPRVMVSVNTLRRRRGPFDVNDWLMDSGAFTQILKHGGYTESPDAYIAEIIRWSTNGNLLAAVSQDMMVEPAMLERTVCGVKTSSGTNSVDPTDLRAAASPIRPGVPFGRL